MEIRSCILCGKPASNRRKRCASCNTRIRRYRAKQAAIDLFGGKCHDCGKEGHQSIFDFHHEYGKDFQIGKVANKSWDVIKKELEKCILLCACCHRLRHNNRQEERFIEEASQYNGTLLK
jgi:hypothetical protein